jgi:PHD/YefM family antitoxin component YafN of YafNO toxin-antitoxin module
MYIKPSTKIRNEFSAISQLARESREPIYITVNGEGDGLYMNIDAYEERELLMKFKLEMELARRCKLAGLPTYTSDDMLRMAEEIMAE